MVSISAMRYRGTTSWKILMSTVAFGAAAIAARAALDEHGGMWVWATAPVFIALGALFAVGVGLVQSLTHGLALAMTLPVVGAFWAILMLRAHHVGPGLSVVFGLLAVISLVLAFKTWHRGGADTGAGHGGHAAGH